MKAVIWHGVGGIRLDDVAEPSLLKVELEPVG